jgi:hypothetical protein
MFPDGYLETVLAAPAALKKDTAKRKSLQTERDPCHSNKKINTLTQDNFPVFLVGLFDLMLL